MSKLKTNSREVTMLKKTSSIESATRAAGERARSLLTSTGWRLSIWYDDRRPYWVLKNGVLQISQDSRGIYSCTADTSATEALFHMDKNPNRAIEKCLKCAIRLVGREWQSVASAAQRVLGVPRSQA